MMTKPSLSPAPRPYLRSFTAVINVGGFFAEITRGAKPIADLNRMRDEMGDVHAVSARKKGQLKTIGT